MVIGQVQEYALVNAVVLPDGNGLSRKRAGWKSDSGYQHEHRRDGSAGGEQVMFHILRAGDGASLIRSEDKPRR